MKNLKNKIAMVGAVALIGASSLVSGCAATRERGIRWVDPLTTLTDTIRYVNGGDMSKEQQDAVGENGNLATLGLDVVRYTRGGDMVNTKKTSEDNSYKNRVQETPRTNTQTASVNSNNSREELKQPYPGANQITNFGEPRLLVYNKWADNGDGKIDERELEGLSKQEYDLSEKDFSVAFFSGNYSGKYSLQIWRWHGENNSKQALFNEQQGEIGENFYNWYEFDTKKIPKGDYTVMVKFDDGKDIGYHFKIKK